LRQRIEHWLTDHPEAAAEVAAQRRLNRLMRQTAAPAPGDAAWATLWERISQAPAPAVLKRAPSRGRWAWPAAVLLAAAVAASLVIAVLAPGPQGGSAPEEVEPFPVVSAEEVEIIRMNGADADVLVVGVPPVAEPLPVANPGEVTLVDIDPGDDDLPDVHMGAQDVPMIWARLDDEVGKSPGS
jgi:anti-sigma factor RsiW